MNYQNELTLITPIKDGDEDILSALLLQIKMDLEAGKKEQFENLNIHFARWIFVNKKEVDEKFENILASRLIFSSIYDGSEEHHFVDLADTLGIFIDQMYQHCVDYPLSDKRSAETRKTYLKKWSVQPAASYVGAPQRSLNRIQKENELRIFIRNFLNVNNWKNKSPVEVHGAVQQQVFSNTDFKWAKESAPLPKVNLLGMVLLGLVLLILSPILIIWLLIIHFFYERYDVPLGLKRSQINEKHMQSLEEYEDLEYQNQLTQVFMVKPGKVRLITVKVMMLFARLLVKFLFVEGKLMGIPTIHFARWLLIDDNKHMIFFSNFDGSWQQYLGDFIDKSGWGLTGIWSNTMHFPITRFLFWGGAYDEEHFLAWARQYQIPTQIWYSAYPYLSIKNIVNNSLIRSELSKNLNERQAEQFLKRF